jgi:hypothetical protein
MVGWLPLQRVLPASQPSFHQSMLVLLQLVASSVKSYMKAARAKCTHAL